MPDETTTLLRVTNESLERAIAQVRVGGRLSDIGHAVQEWVEAHGFSIVREFVGHGIGERLHEDPQIPNYGPPGRGPKLAEGMVLAIEPMVAMGRPETRVLGDGWTAVTSDGSLAAHFEHTVAVTTDGPLVLTARPVRSAKSSRPEAGRSGCRGWRRAAGEAPVTGTIVAILPRALYRVAVGDGHEVVAHAPTGPGRNFVRLVVGDRVTVELSRRDGTRGRITRKS